MKRPGPEIVLPSQAPVGAQQAGVTIAGVEVVPQNKPHPARAAQTAEYRLLFRGRARCLVRQQDARQGALVVVVEGPTRDRLVESHHITWPGLPLHDGHYLTPGLLDIRPDIPREQAVCHHTNKDSPSRRAPSAAQTDQSRGEDDHVSRESHHHVSPLVQTYPEVDQPRSRQGNEEMGEHEDQRKPPLPERPRATHKEAAEHQRRGQHISCYCPRAAQRLVRNGGPACAHPEKGPPDDERACWQILRHSAEGGHAPPARTSDLPRGYHRARESSSNQPAEGAPSADEPRSVCPRQRQRLRGNGERREIVQVER